jgi:hypothetical protein
MEAIEQTKQEGKQTMAKRVPDFNMVIYSPKGGQIRIPLWENEKQLVGSLGVQRYLGATTSQDITIPTGAKICIFKYEPKEKKEAI